MACERNRIVVLTQYLQSLGIDVNIGKNKARGNKGVFIGAKNKYRIDISKNLEEDKILSVIVHEFSHYVHFCYDKTLNSLEFIFDDYDEEIEEELINITVLSVPKDVASKLFDTKETLKKEIKELSALIKSNYSDFKLSTPLLPLERSLKIPVKYLLKYDRIRVFNKIYSIEKLKEDFEYLSEIQIAYIMIKSKQRMLKRINSRISKLNKYYNNPTELFARFAEYYFLKQEEALKIAPKATQLMNMVIDYDKIPELTHFSKLLNFS